MVQVKNFEFRDLYYLPLALPLVQSFLRLYDAPSRNYVRNLTQAQKVSAKEKACAQTLETLKKQEA